MTSVTVNKRVNTITVKSSAAGILSSTPTAVTIQNLGTIAAAASRLDQLSDFVEGTPQDGDIIVYNAADDKYYVQSLNLQNQNLDGGDF